MVLTSIFNNLGSHSGVSVRLASGQDSCSEEPGRLAAASYENGGRVVPPDTIAVLLQDIPGENTVFWWRQAITRPNVDFSSTCSCVTHLDTSYNIHRLWK